VNAVRWANNESANCLEEGSFDSLLITSVLQGRLIRRKTPHPVIQARTPSHLPIFADLLERNVAHRTEEEWLV